MERQAVGVTVTPDLMEQFLEHLREKGRTPETVLTYRRNLTLLYEYLPEEKEIGVGMLEQWREMLLADGYAPRTTNVCISTANSLLEYCGRRDLQIGKVQEPEDAMQPELSRMEYLRLLSTARMLGKERVYLLVKVFGCMGLNIQELPQLTIEAVQAGYMVLSGKEIQHIPDGLREELLHFAKRSHIQTGPLFVTKEGASLHRTSISTLILRLGRDAGVAPEKCNPRCLRKLYLSTQEGIRFNLGLLIEQAHNRLLEKEQLTIGWAQEE